MNINTVDAFQKYVSASGDTPQIDFMVEMGRYRGSVPKKIRVWKSYAKPNLTPLLMYLGVDLALTPSRVKILQSMLADVEKYNEKHGVVDE